jgi:hypothetical protein
MIQAPEFNRFNWKEDINRFSVSDPLTMSFPTSYSDRYAISEELNEGRGIEEEKSFQLEIKESEKKVILINKHDFKEMPERSSI